MRGWSPEKYEILLFCLSFQETGGRRSDTLRRPNFFRERICARTFPVQVFKKCFGTSAVHDQDLLPRRFSVLAKALFQGPRTQEVTPPKRGPKNVLVFFGPNTKPMVRFASSYATSSCSGFVKETPLKTMLDELQILIGFVSEEEEGLLKGESLHARRLVGLRYFIVNCLPSRKVMKQGR